MRRKILLTGGSGMVGQEALKELLRRSGEYDVRVFDQNTKANRKFYKKINDKIDLVYGDLRNPEAIEKAVNNIEAVIHLAAIIPPAADENHELAREVNVDLSVILIHVPSLKERKEDIPLLVEQFLREIAEEYKMPIPKITKKAMEQLLALDWRGNVRELHNVIERLVILCDREVGEQDVISYAVPRKSKKLDESIFDRYDKFQEFKDFAEKEFIERKLKKNGWNITKTAEEIDIQRSHLYNKIEKFGLKREKN